MAKAWVLLVEDEPFIRELLSEVLGEAGLHVVEADNGEAAMLLLEQVGGLELLVTDVHMPGRFDGIDVARYARARYPDLPVVFATGRPEAVETFGPLGAHEVCMAKPFRPSEMLQVVEHLLSKEAASKQKHSSQRRTLSHHMA